MDRGEWTKGSGLRDRNRGTGTGTWTGGNGLREVD